jgi:hypothetical protein
MIVSSSTIHATVLKQDTPSSVERGYSSNPCAVQITHRV